MHAGTYFTHPPIDQILDRLVELANRVSMTIDGHLVERERRLAARLGLAKYAQYPNSLSSMLIYRGRSNLILPNPKHLVHASKATNQAMRELRLRSDLLSALTQFSMDVQNSRICPKIQKTKFVSTVGHQPLLNAYEFAQIAKVSSSTAKRWLSRAEDSNLMKSLLHGGQRHYYLPSILVAFDQFNRDEFGGANLTADELVGFSAAKFSIYNEISRGS